VVERVPGKVPETQVPSKPCGPAFMLEAHAFPEQNGAAPAHDNGLPAKPVRGYDAVTRLRERDHASLRLCECHPRRDAGRRRDGHFPGARAQG